MSARRSGWRRRSLAAGCLLLACALAWGAPGAAPASWPWSQDVRFVADHDPGRIVLEGTDNDDIEVIYDGIAWEQVDAWPKGKPLRLAYSEKTGTVLVDPDSGRWLTVVDGMRAYPIDLLLDACRKTAASTADIQACYGDAYHRWDAQMNLWYRRFMDSRDEDIDAAARQSLQQAQRQWLKYRDAQIEALGALYGHRQGTIWPLVGMQKRVGLPKARALALASYLQAL